jgi:hypothetical protein
MIRTRLLVGLLGLALTGMAAVGCNDDDDGAGDGTPVATAQSSTSPDRTSSDPSTTTADATNAAPDATAPARTPGAALDDEGATAILNEVLLAPGDIDDSGWVIQSDTTTDNAAAAAAMPEQAASNERCGRLLSRLITNFPDDPLNAFIGGTTLAFFSTATVYRDAAGAADCAEETATKLAEPGALARQFGSVFADPAAVVVSPVEYETLADGSFAATLSGQTNAGGTVIDLTVLIVAFRSGNVTAVVGSARSGGVPPLDELKPFVDVVLKRIQENQ